MAEGILLSFAELRAWNPGTGTEQLKRPFAVVLYSLNAQPAWPVATQYHQSIAASRICQTPIYPRLSDNATYSQALIPSNLQTMAQNLTNAGQRRAISCQCGAAFRPYSPAFKHRNSGTNMMLISRETLALNPEPIATNRIRQGHRTVFEVALHAGRLRQVLVRVDQFTPPQPGLLLQMLENLESAYRGTQLDAAHLVNRP